MQLIFILAFAGVLVLFFSQRGLREALVEALDNFRGGGPPSPMHPSPADDAVLLRKRARKSEI